MEKSKRKAAKGGAIELAWRSTRAHYTGDYTPILRIRGGLMLVSHSYIPQPCMVTWNLSALDEFIREARKNSKFTFRYATKQQSDDLENFQARYAPFLNIVHPSGDIDALIEPNIPGFTDAPKAARDKLFLLRDELKRLAVYAESRGRKAGSSTERTLSLRKAIMGEFRRQKTFGRDSLSGYAKKVRGLLKNSPSYQHLRPVPSAKRIESIIRSEQKKKHPTSKPRPS